jgi:hypothetical protein
MRILRLAMVTTLLSSSMLWGTARAGDFSPAISFALCTADSTTDCTADQTVAHNPQVRVHVEQDTGEDTLAHIQIRVPAGFKLPTDKKLADGDQVGTADITIDAGPRCAGGGPVSAPATFTGKSISEQDRTDAQIAKHIKDVWILDLQPVATIELDIYGSKLHGYRIEGDIPANDFTCPPFTFDAQIFAKSTTGQVPVFVNPITAGDYTFTTTFTSTADPAGTSTATQTVTITP